MWNAQILQIIATSAIALNSLFLIYYSKWQKSIRTCYDVTCTITRQKQSYLYDIFIFKLITTGQELRYRYRQIKHFSSLESWVWHSSWSTFDTCELLNALIKAVGFSIGILLFLLKKYQGGLGLAPIWPFHPSCA